MDRYYTFANICIRVTGQTEWLTSEDAYLAPFRSECRTPRHSLHLQIVEELDGPEGPCVFTGANRKVFYQNRNQLRYDGVRGDSLKDAYMRIHRFEEDSWVQVRRSSILDRVDAKLILAAMELEHQMVQCHGFLFHSSYIRHGDGAILFTAPSGTGKTTQADLWCRLRNAELINGDRSAVMMENGKAMVHGIPYSGSSGVSRNVTLPLKAIVRLTQAPKTKIETLTGLAAFRHVWEGCTINTWNRNDMSLCMETVMELVQSVPVFHLACTPDESAVIALEEMLQNVR